MAKKIKKISKQKNGSYKDNVLGHIPNDDTLLTSYAEMFLEKVSSRTLEDESPTEWSAFLTERFKFFNTAVNEGGKFTFSTNKEGNRTILEWVYFGATHSMITIENLFLEFGINIILRINPVLGVKKDKSGKVSSIGIPTLKLDRIANLYMEFDPIDEETLTKLTKRMVAHICAVDCAFSDQKKMIDLVDDLQSKVEETDFVSSEPHDEWTDAIKWLKSSYYFSGYVSFNCKKNNGDSTIVMNKDTRLGVCRDDYLKMDESKLIPTLENYVWRCQNRERSFAFDTIQVTSPIQRFENLMRFSIKILGKGKNETIIHNFLGLIKHSSLQSRNLETPLIRLKMQDIFENGFMLPESYNYNEVIRIFDSIPKFELFRTYTQDLQWMVQSILSINGLHKIRCFSRPKNDGENTLLIMVAVPTYNFTIENIEKIKVFLKEFVPHSRNEFIEIRGHSAMCRIHCYFELPGEGDWEPDTFKLETEIEAHIKPWGEKIKDKITSMFSSSVAEKYCQFYLPLMPSHYRGRATVVEAVRDIVNLEKLAHSHEIQFELDVFEVSGSVLSSKVSIIYIYSHSKIDLITVMPMLKNMGLYVYDQITTRIGSMGTTIGYIQSFRVSTMDRGQIDPGEYKDLLGKLTVEIFNGRTSDDALNSLALKAKLDWRGINVLQLYRNLLIQIKAPYTRGRISQCLLKYPGFALKIYEYFDSKFNPDSGYGDLNYRKIQVLPSLKESFIEGLSKVSAVADDTILRRILNLVEGTLRTNFYIPKENNETFISIKLDSSLVEQMPIPIPYREMFVHDVGVQGTHLRFGPVARGGLRWSDRPDDFRTEVLGLVKTQQTKNVVIVPVGSKGGFVIRKATTTREEAATESNKQYKKFISGLLDITDNMDSNRQASHPSHVFPYDGLDPYLVVAADKGTATFSDTANEISQSYKFWLGDGFASGGSNGYDHKKEGITARGGWECVKLHFKEMGKDIQTEKTTAIGIGDMSGDVFGNGMLLSKSIQLQAAFNHIHIFLDPNPVPEDSWKERKRLFDTPRSSWKDYNAKFISKGGGIFDRSAKSINLPQEIKEMIKFEGDALSGEELITHVLKMEVELVWFGGIGTYIKSDSQNDIEVGDRANDNVRINVSEVNAKVIGEGANLGITGLGRIELNKRNVRINSDAIDNSAGVNMSDYEVNIKILLQLLLDSGKIKSDKVRNIILAEATDEVSELNLANNRGQHRLLSMDGIRSQSQFKLFKNLIKYLISKGMNAKSEYVPKGKELEALEHSGKEMPRPISAVLQAYVKMYVFEYFQGSELLDDSYFDDLFLGYFPNSIVRKFSDDIHQHPLKKEIIATVLTNQIVNQAGSTFYYRMEQNTGKSIDEITQAYIILDSAIGGLSLRGEILEAENVTEAHKYEALIRFEEVLHALTHHMLKLTSNPSFEMIQKYSTLLEDVENVFSLEAEEFHLTISYWKGKGFEYELAKDLAVISQLKGAPDVIYLHEEENLTVPSALRLSIIINDAFYFEWLTKKLYSIEPATDWELSLQDILTQNLELYKFNLLRILVNYHGEETLKALSPDEIVKSVRGFFEIPLGNFFKTIEMLKLDPLINLTTLSVSINRLNFLAEAKALAIGNKKSEDSATA